MKRVLFIVIAAAMLGAVACGDDDAEPEASGGSVTTTTGSPAVSTTAPAPKLEPWQCTDPTATKPAPGTELVFVYGSGPYGENVGKVVIPALERDTGLKVTHIKQGGAATTGQIVAAGGDADIDVYLPSFSALTTAVQANVLKEIDRTALSEAKDIPPENLDALPGEAASYAVGVSSYAYGIGYNKEELARLNLPVPKAFDDLFNPVYGGKVGIYAPPNASAIAQIATFNALEGGPQGDVTKGLAKLATLKGKAKIYTGNDQISAAVPAKEVVVWFDAAPTSQTLADAGLPVSMVFPPNAPVALSAGAIPTGSRDKGAPACTFLNWALSSAGQKAFVDIAKEGAVRPGIAPPAGSLTPPIEDFDEPLQLSQLIGGLNSEKITEEWNKLFS